MSPHHLPVQLMIRREEILPLRQPRPRSHSQTDNRLGVHSCGWQQLTSGQEPEQFIPQPHDCNQLAGFSAQSLFVLKGFPTAPHHDFGQRPMHIV